MIAKPPTARSRHAGRAPGTPTATDRDPATVRCLAEELSVDGERLENGRVRVGVSTGGHDETIEVPLLREHVEVERIAIGREVRSIPPARQEGDTVIVPVVEEVVVVRRKLVLKEEVHLRLVRATEQHRERVSVRRQHAVVERLPVEQPSMEQRSDPASPGGPQPSPADKGHSA
jgi:uncharacterized protein (TIGR02271 family)